MAREGDLTIRRSGRWVLEVHALWTIEQSLRESVSGEKGL